MYVDIAFSRRDIAAKVCELVTLKNKSSRWYPTETNYTDDLTLLTNTPAKAESLLYHLEQAAGVIKLYMNVNKMEFKCFNQKEAITILNGKPLKSVCIIHD